MYRCSIFLVLFPMLAEFPCVNDPYLSLCQKFILFLASWICQEVLSGVFEGDLQIDFM